VLTPHHYPMLHRHLAAVQLFSLVSTLKLPIARWWLLPHTLCCYMLTLRHHPMLHYHLVC
jgi:hypothetical protein